MKYIIGCALLTAALAVHAAKDNRSAWLESKWYGSDNSVAALRPIAAEQEEGFYTVRIENQFAFECELTFGKNGDPAELKDCVSRPKVPDKVPWTASPKIIKLRCVSTKRERICKGKYTLGQGEFSDAAEFTIARKR